MSSAIQLDVMKPHPVMFSRTWNEGDIDTASPVARLGTTPRLGMLFAPIVEGNTMSATCVAKRGRPLVADNISPASPAVVKPRCFSTLNRFENNNNDCNQVVSDEDDDYDKLQDEVLHPFGFKRIKASFSPHEENDQQDTKQAANVGSCPTLLGKSLLIVPTNQPSFAATKRMLGKWRNKEAGEQRANSTRQKIFGGAAQDNDDDNNKKNNNDDDDLGSPLCESDFNTMSLPSQHEHEASLHQKLVQKFPTLPDANDDDIDALDNCFTAPLPKLKLQRRPMKRDATIDGAGSLRQNGLFLP